MSSDAQIIFACLPNPAAWTPIPLAGGISATTFFNTPASRQWADQVELSGSVNGTFTTGGVTIGTLAAQFWPAIVVEIGGVAFTSGLIATACSIQISTAGVVKATPGAAAVSVRLDGVRYRII